MRINYLLAACSHRAEIVDLAGVKGRTVLRQHLKELLKTDTSSLAQLTLLRALPLIRGPDSDEYWDVEDILGQVKCPLEVLDVPDRLFSYSSWIAAAQKYREQFDYYILIEDDYYPVIPDFANTLVGLHQELLPNGGFLCSFKANDHAAVSNGIVDARTFLETLDSRADPIADISDAAQEMFSTVLFGTRLADYTNSFRTLFFNKGSGISEQVHQRGSRPAQDLLNPIQYLKAEAQESFPISIHAPQPSYNFPSPKHNLKHLIHVTAPITTSIDADNLRGEPRWERNVLDTYVLSGRTVHTTLPVWRSKNIKAANFHDGYNPDWAQESILTTYGVPSTPNLPVPAKYYVVQYLDGPNENQKDSFLKHDKERPGSIIATCNFRTWEYMERLQRVLGSENVKFVQGPAIPYTVDHANNFGKPQLLWLYRNFWYCAKEDPAGMALLFNQVAGYMRANPELRLAILVGAWDPQEVPDIRAEGRQWALSHSFMKEVLPFHDRINVYSQLHWHQVLELVQDTHLVISPPEPLGGPPYEAAMYGVPIVVGEYNPFQDRDLTPFFPEVLVSRTRRCSGQFLEYIDRLYHDHTFYRSTGDAYRNYVRENATYAAYVRQIDKIAEERGWA